LEKGSRVPGVKEQKDYGLRGKGGNEELKDSRIPGFKDSSEMIE